MENYKHYPIENITTITIDGSVGDADATEVIKYLHANGVRAIMVTTSIDASQVQNIFI